MSKTCLHFQRVLSIGRRETRVSCSVHPSQSSQQGQGEGTERCGRFRAHTGRDWPRLQEGGGLRLGRRKGTRPAAGTAWVRVRGAGTASSVTAGQRFPPRALEIAAEKVDQASREGSWRPPGEDLENQTKATSLGETCLGAPHLKSSGSPGIDRVR